MVKKQIVKSSKSKAPSNKENVNKILIENFVSLQKVMTNLSSKFDNLAGQISKLLELFEISAKALAEKDFGDEKEKKDNKKVLEKIDNLLEQNKIIARGVTLLHESSHEQKFENPFPGKPIPPQPQNTENAIDAGQYQKSFSSGYNKLPKR